VIKFVEGQFKRVGGIAHVLSPFKICRNIRSDVGPTCRKLFRATVRRITPLQGEGMCLSVTCQAGKTEHPDAAGHASATQPTAGAYRRLAKLMVELGWAAVRGRDLTRGGYKE
jgi:hypothetical protein